MARRNNNLMNSFVNLPKDEIIDNSYVVLKETNLVDKFSSELDKFRRNSNLFESTRKKIDELYNLSLNTESDFFKKIGAQVPQDSASHAQAFTSYINLQNFFKTNTDDNNNVFVSTVINGDTFRGFLEQGLSEAVLAGGITEENYKERYTEIIGEAFKQGLKDLSPDFFSFFDRSNKEIMSDLEMIFGKTYIENRLKQAKNAAIQKNQVKIQIGKNRGSEGRISGLLNEWAMSLLQGTLTNSLEKQGYGNITINVENTGTKKIEHERMFYNSLTRLKIVKDKNTKEEHMSYSTYNFGKDVLVSRKADNIIDISFSDGTNIFKYKLYISNKFRSGKNNEWQKRADNMEVDLQGGSSVNTQINQIKGLLGKSFPQIEDILRSLMFVVLNSAPGAIFENPTNVLVLEHFLDQIAIVYMFDDVASTILDTKTANVLLFQVNAGFVPASAILESVLTMMNNPYFIQTEILHRANAKDVYNKLSELDIVDKDTPQERATYVRNTFLTGGMATSFKTLFNHDLLSKTLNFNGLLTGRG